MKRYLAYFFVAVIWSVNATAQMFSPQGGQTLPKAAPVQRPAGASSWRQEEKAPVKNDAMEQINSSFVNSNKVKTSNNPLDQISQALEKSSNKADGGAAAEAMSKNSKDDIFIPEGELYRLDTPTLDGSVRGGQAFVEVDQKGRMKKASNIFLYYDNFKVTNYLTGVPTCDVRFNVLSNLDQKINKLDVKLVWPGMTTTLSFSNVSPNTQTYYNYSLLGKGCYNMDKFPNIIVNRCRVKGMTAAECANKLVWLSK